MQDQKFDIDKELVYGFEMLLKSAQKCKRGVMWKARTMSIMNNLLENIYNLTIKLQNNTYKCKKPAIFTIKYPKEREILSINFLDRIYQRSLNDLALYPAMSKSFIKGNCACQINKGTTFAIELLKEYMHRAYRKYKSNKFSALKIDIKSYYKNINHQVALDIFRRYLSDWLYKEVEEILKAQYKNNIGFNPGSQMVQIAGISILSPIDHFIKERLRIKYYIRYMDDFILLHHDKDYLKHCYEEIRKKLNDIGLDYNNKKTTIIDIDNNNGIIFLGFKFKLSDSGHIDMLLGRKNIKHHIQMLYRLRKKVINKTMEIEQFDMNHTSWKAHANLSKNSHNLIRFIDGIYNEIRAEIINELKMARHKFQ